jgi:hypothetical protein
MIGYIHRIFWTEAQLLGTEVFMAISFSSLNIYMASFSSFEAKRDWSGTGTVSDNVTVGFELFCLTMGFRI